MSNQSLVYKCMSFLPLFLYRPGVSELVMKINTSCSTHVRVPGIQF